MANLSDLTPQTKEVLDAQYIEPVYKVDEVNTTSIQAAEISQPASSNITPSAQTSSTQTQTVRQFDAAKREKKEKRDSIIFWTDLGMKAITLFYFIYIIFSKKNK